MATVTQSAEVTRPPERASTPNGRAMAAFLGAGIGGFATGAVVLLNEAGLVTPPTLYAPAGGVSGRTTVAAIIWLIAWFLLDRQWQNRRVSPAPVAWATLTLVGLGILGTFPPVWSLL
jgi:hypothetical protein